MKSHPQATAELKHLAEKLEHHRVAMLTMNENGTGLASRPMTPLEMDPDGAIWIMGSHPTLDATFEGRSQPVNLAFADPGDSAFVSVVGDAALVDDAARKKDLWTAAGRPWFDGPDDPKLALIRITPKSAEIWDGPSTGVGRVLAMAASIVAGKEVGLGKKETLKV